MAKIEKTTLRCFLCRKKIAELHLNTPIYFEEAYDFCPLCVGHMVRNMERDMLGLSPLALNHKPRLRLEARTQEGENHLD